MNTPDNLRELLHGITSVLVDVADAKKDDGRVSAPEALLIAWRERDEIRRAIEGLANIPSEVLHLDREGTEILRAEIVADLHRLGRTHRSQDIADRILRLAVEAVATVRDIQSQPPAAEPA